MEHRLHGSAEAIEQLTSSLQEMMSLERFSLHNATSFRSKDADPPFDSRFLPENSNAFELPCFRVPRKDVYVCGRPSDKESEIGPFELDSGDKHVLFPIHPLEVDNYRPFLLQSGAREARFDGLRIWAVPTSSARTLLAWPDGRPDQAVFVKATISSPIFGDRRISRRKMETSIGLSMLVECSNTLPRDFNYLYERMGIVPRRMQNGAAIFRSLPNEVRENRVLLVPLFALLESRGGGIPLLLTICERAAVHPLEFIEKELCSSFAKAWLAIAAKHGLLLEAHGQDLLLVVTPDFVPLNRFYYRDFEGMAVDWQLRRTLGFIEPDGMPCAANWHETYNTWGYRYFQMAWRKWYTSLYDYLHFVLAELDSALPQWRKQGLIGKVPLESDFATRTFSRYLISELECMFGIKVRPRYNIYKDLRAFVRFLMELRIHRAVCPYVPTEKVDSRGYALMGGCDDVER